jgi:hypothetical protein
MRLCGTETAGEFWERKVVTTESFPHSSCWVDTYDDVNSFGQNGHDAALLSGDV